jgi:hypothetical protein
MLQPPLLNDFDDVSVHTVPEDLEFNHTDSMDSEPSGDTTEELPSLNDELVISEHDDDEIQQTELMKIDEGVEQYYYKCHLIYYGTAMEHDSECRLHGYCMTHIRLEEPRYGYSRCNVATLIPIPGPISTLGKPLICRLPNYTAIGPRYGDWMDE